MKTFTVFYLNAGSRTDQNELFIRQLKGAGIRATRIPAFEGDCLDMTAISRALGIRPPLTGNHLKDCSTISPREFACICSHVYAFTQAAQKGVSALLVLEDDMLIPNDLQQRCLRIPELCDIVCLAGAVPTGTQTTQTMVSLDGFETRASVTGAYAVYGQSKIKDISDNLLSLLRNPGSLLQIEEEAKVTIGRHDGTPAIDLFFRFFQQNRRCFSVVPAWFNRSTVPREIPPQVNPPT